MPRGARARIVYRATHRRLKIKRAKAPKTAVKQESTHPPQFTAASLISRNAADASASKKSTQGQGHARPSCIACARKGSCRRTGGWVDG